MKPDTSIECDPSENGDDFAFKTRIYHFLTAMNCGDAYGVTENIWRLIEVDREHTRKLVNMEYQPGYVRLKSREQMVKELWTSNRKLPGLGSFSEQTLRALCLEYGISIEEARQ